MRREGRVAARSTRRALAVVAALALAAGVLTPLRVGWATPVLGGDEMSWLASSGGSLLAVVEPAAAKQLLMGLLGLLGLAVSGSRSERR
ncbi:MAG TPA: hypothetical protein VMW35_17185 [Myxococcota bacterium]|jgi:hypothetical protein|nr:hypothetical protein [Myxococcota bacterium]